MVDFEDPIVITENDIISIDCCGIKHCNGYIDFSDCANNFSAIENTQSITCVASRDSTGSWPSFDFYTTGRVTQIFFVDKGKILTFLSKASTTHRFHAFNKKLQSLGWTTYDLS